MLPAPSTMASSVPLARTAAICSAMALSRSGSVPKSSEPMRASPDSFSRTRLKAGAKLRGLDADLEAREALDDDVLAGLGRQLGAQLLDGLAAVLVLVDVLLAQEDDLVEPLAELALRRALARLLGHVLHLAHRDPQLLAAALLGDLLLGDELGPRRGDLQRDLLREAREVVVARDEVGVAVDLDEHADLAVGVDVGLHGALGGLAAGELGRAGDALLAQPGDGGFDVAAGLGQRLLAVHHPGAGAVAQGLDVLGGDGDVGHWASSLVLCWSLAGASSTPFSTSASLVSGSPSSAGGSGRSSPGRSVRWRSVRSARWRTAGSGCGRPPACAASATSASASWRGSPSPPDTSCSWRSRSACSAASRAACSSASRRARSSASRRACSSASRRAASSSARKVNWPSRTTSPIALVISAHARMASSLPGMT